MRWLYIAIFTALFVLPAMIVLEALLAYYVCNTTQHRCRHIYKCHLETDNICRLQSAVHNRTNADVVFRIIKNTNKWPN